MVCRYQADGYAVYFFPNVVRSGVKYARDADVTAVRALFVDADGGLPVEYHAPPDIVINSSAVVKDGKRIQKGGVYWLLSDMLPVEEFRPAQQRLIAHYSDTADKAVHNPARIMRLPGSLHRKPAVDGNEMRRLLAENLPVPLTIPQLVTFDTDGAIRWPSTYLLDGLPEVPAEAPRKARKTRTEKPEDDDPVFPEQPRSWEAYERETTYLNLFCERDGWRGPVGAMARAAIIGEDADPNGFADRKRRLIQAALNGEIFHRALTEEEKSHLGGIHREEGEVDRLIEWALNYGVAGWGTLDYHARKEGWEPSFAEMFGEHIKAMGTNADGWPEPVDIFGDMRDPQPSLRKELLPDVIADWAWDEADRLGVEPSMLAIAAVLTFAAATDNRIRIQPKQHDTWAERAILWGIALAPPGGKKTPALNKALAPLREIAAEWRVSYRKAAALYEERLEAHKTKVKNGEAEPGWENEPKPVEPRLTVGSITMEKLGEILEENQHGVLAIYDEIGSFIGGFDAYRSNGSRQDREAALELWNGERREVDRKTAGSSYDVPIWGSGVIGGCQPEKLPQLGGRNGLTHDGLIQRFVFFGGDNVGRGADREPNKRAIACYYQSMRAVASFSPDHQSFPIEPIKLSPGARQHWDRVIDLAEKLTGEMALPAALREHMAKVPGLCARLMLTLHMVECSPFLPNMMLMVVNEMTARRAADLMIEYFLPLAIRVFRELCPTDDDSRTLQKVARVILASDGDAITDRDIYRGCDALAGKDNAPVRQRMMTALSEYGWVRPQLVNGWTINPKVRPRFEQQRAEARAHAAREHARAVDARRAWRETWG